MRKPEALVAAHATRRSFMYDMMGLSSARAFSRADSGRFWGALRRDVLRPCDCGLQPDLAATSLLRRTQICVGTIKVSLHGLGSTPPRPRRRPTHAPPLRSPVRPEIPRRSRPWRPAPSRTRLFSSQRSGASGTHSRTATGRAPPPPPQWANPRPSARNLGPSVATSPRRPSANAATPSTTRST